MRGTCELTAMELYFCARLLKADYLDYDYIRSMPDIQKNHLLHEQETLEELERKGMIEQDFEENISFDSETEALLRPVFFGGQEARLDVPGQTSRRFHIYEGSITMGVIGDGKISFTAVTDAELETFLTSGDAEIHFSDVLTGKKSGVFTKEDLKSKENQKLAVQLMKGEV